MLHGEVELEDNRYCYINPKDMANHGTMALGAGYYVSYDYTFVGPQYICFSKAGTIWLGCSNFNKKLYHGRK